MDNMLESLGVGLGLIAMYGTGLIFWPIQRLKAVNETGKERQLFRLFLAQGGIYVLWGVWALILVSRQGNWLKWILAAWPVNVLFFLIAMPIFASKEKS